MGEPLFPTERVTIMGVLNVTPDSFSDGGRLHGASGRIDLGRVLSAARELTLGGAHILDVGGESTRPFATPVSDAEEIDRTAVAIEALAREIAVPISIDTRKSKVARAALDAGATLINDVTGGSHDPRLAHIAAEEDVTLVLGHIRGTPENMQVSPEYDDVLEEVASELEASVARAREAGVAASRLVVDPGIGFGKRLEDNLQLIVHGGWLRDRLGLPLLTGPSRKSFLGRITGDETSERDTATHAACAVAVFCGADGVRVHDAAGARRAVAVGRALRGADRKRQKGVA